MIQLDGATIGTRIIKELRNKFVGLSLDKYGSNVVERCLSCCESGANQIIFEIIENDETRVRVCTNEYGNYVVQRAISVAKVISLSLDNLNIRYYFEFNNCRVEDRTNRPLECCNWFLIHWVTQIDTYLLVIIICYLLCNYSS